MKKRRVECQVDDIVMKKLAMTLRRKKKKMVNLDELNYRPQFNKNLYYKSC